jgi:acetyltransferase
VTAADALEGLGLELAELGSNTKKSLGRILPPAASLVNPVDMLASAGPAQFADCLRIVLADPGVDSAMVIYPTPPMYTSGAVAKAIIPVVHGADKPVVVAVMGERLIQEAVEHLRAARIPEFRFPERAAAALSALVERSELLRIARAEPMLVNDVDRQAASSIVRSAPKTSAQLNDFLLPEASQEVLEAYGIPTLKMELTRDPGEAVTAARRIGYPVAVKVASPDIPHKSDVGGVLLDLEDEDSVRAAYESVVRRSRQSHPTASIEGVHIQQMVPSGQEVIVGAVQDSQFGALVMFGSGGIEVEGLKDVYFALAPLTLLEAEQMLRSTWAGRKLSGYRNIPPADRDAVVDTLVRIAQLAHEHPELAEIEINPLRVLPAGQGVVAVDVRIRIQP